MVRNQERKDGTVSGEQEREKLRQRIGNEEIETEKTREAKRDKEKERNKLRQRIRKDEIET